MWPGALYGVLAVSMIPSTKMVSLWDCLGTFYNLQLSYLRFIMWDKCTIVVDAMKASTTIVNTHARKLHGFRKWFAPRRLQLEWCMMIEAVYHRANFEAILRLVTGHNYFWSHEARCDLVTPERPWSYGRNSTVHSASDYLFSPDEPKTKRI